MAHPRDTSAEARKVQLDALRRLEGATRLAMACRMSDEARSISEAGIRYRHPEWREPEVREATRNLLLGEDLARQVSLWDGARRLND